MDRDTTIEGAIWLLNHTNDKSVIQECFSTIEANKDYVLSKKRYSDELYKVILKLQDKYERRELDAELDEKEDVKYKVIYKADKVYKSTHFLNSACMYFTGFSCAVLLVTTFMYFGISAS
jgi:hypothetical protein